MNFKMASTTGYHVISRNHILNDSRQGFSKKIGKKEIGEKRY